MIQFKRSFQRILFVKMSRRPFTIEEKLEEFREGSISTADFIEVDDQVITAETLSDSEIVASTQDADESEDEECSEETTRDPCPKVYSI
jgi:hypothetical protein